MVNNQLKGYFEAVALGNGDSYRFVELIRGMKLRYIVFHSFLIICALNFPVMLSIVRLEPYELFSRLHGETFTEIPSGDFNAGLYQEGYGTRVLLPVLGFMFGLMVLLTSVFFLGAAVSLGMQQRIMATSLPFRDRLGIFVLSSTIPVIGAVILGLWLPTLHIVVFYMVEIILGFFLVKKWDRLEKMLET
ncbi:hypothetical protein FACS1894172_07180 [Spirochaetia bacterium]|nr:hypothetical protein FACS1894172_07180 [Spirochaetia bacterium]